MDSLGTNNMMTQQPNGIKEEGPNPGPKMSTAFGRFRIHGNTDTYSLRRVRGNQKTIFPTSLPFSGAREQGRERETGAGQSGAGELTTSGRLLGLAKRFFFVTLVRSYTTLTDHPYTLMHISTEERARRIRIVDSVEPVLHHPGANI